MNRDRIIILVAVIGMFLSLAGSGMLMKTINAQRIDLQLTANEDIMKNLPPQYAIPYMAMGAFRGLVINFAWVRLEQMKQDGQFWEAMQLSELITKLQPRFPQVWANRAWNLSYNISVMTHTPLERWMWVRSGINLLRDEGIPNNPNSVLIYKELAWIFLHKIGMDSDDLHRYYKAKLAEEWHFFLGEPPNGTSQEVVDAFRPIAQMYDKYVNRTHLSLNGRAELEKLKADPELRDEVLKFHELPSRRMAVRVQRLYNQWLKRDPRWAARLKPLHDDLQAQQAQIIRNPIERFLEGEPDVQPLVDELARLGYKLDGKLMDRVGRIIAREKSFDLSLLTDEQLRKIVDDEATTKLKEAFAVEPLAEPAAKTLAFLRAYLLETRYHMDPLWMLELMEGRWFVPPDEMAELVANDEVPLAPIDWRHPGAHGLYWAALGVRRSQGLVKPEDFDLMNTDRQVLHGLQAMTHSGKMVYDPFSGPDGGYLSTLPDMRFFEAYHYAVQGAPHRIISERVKGTTAIESFEAGHENFMIWNVCMLYWYGMEAKAEKFYQVLRATFSEREAKSRDRYAQPLAQFVYSEFADAEQITDRDVVAGMINGMLQQAIEQGLLAQRPEVFQRLLETSRVLYTNYQRAQDYRTLVSPDEINRMALRPFNQLVAEAFITYLGYSPISPLVKARVWNSLPSVEIKQRVYDFVKPRFVAQLKGSAIDPDKAMPEPPGMAEYRVEKATEIKATEEGMKQLQLESQRRSGQR